MFHSRLRRACVPTIRSIYALVALAVATGSLLVPRSGDRADAGPAVDAWVDAVHEEFLGRPATDTELSRHRAVAATTSGRNSIALGLARSREGHLRFIRLLYADALGRNVDPAGSRYWVDRLQSGASTRTIAASVLGSDEAFRRHASTEAFVTDLYNRLLNRAPDAEGLAHWSRRIIAGQAPGVVVSGIWDSPEYRADRVTDAYRDVLDRLPDGPGLAYWSARLGRLDEVDLAASLAASAEYYRRVTGVDPPIDAPVGTRPSSGSTAGATAPGGHGALAAEGFSNHDPSYLGNPWWAMGVGNVPLKGDTTLAFRFRARYSATMIATSFYLVENTSRTGYSSGDCGEVLVTLQPDRGGVPSGQVVAQAHVPHPCDGPRPGQWLTNLVWERPVAVTAGLTYHLVFSNPDPDPVNNWISVNCLYRPGDDPAQVAFSTGGGTFTALASGSNWYGNPDGSWGRRNTLEDYFPLFEARYSDGTRQGLSFVGTRSSDLITLTPGGVRTAQTLTPTITRSLNAVWVRPTTVAAGTRLRARVATTNGQVLAETELSAQGGWWRGQLPHTVDMQAGTGYRVEVWATAGSASFRALYRAEHDDWISNGTSDLSTGYAEVGDGSSWSPHRGDDWQDLPLYVS